MRVVESTDKLNTAVQECLSQCYSSPCSAVCLVKFLRRLRLTGSWSSDEVASIRSAVVCVLRRIASPDPQRSL
jgi:hypothetical protein